MQLPIGILGGTFDPIHCGHLAIAEYLSAHGLLTQIQFIPCLLPPHRQPPQASPQQRLAMLELAIAGHPGWAVNPIDLERPGPSYMVDTLTLLRQRQPSTPWCLILGMDAFLHFDQWREWRRILTLAHLIVVNRPGFELPSADWGRELLAHSQVESFQHLTQSLAGKILLQEIPPSPLSATAIRLQSGAAPSQSLPPAVWQYIQQHHLYSC